MKILFIYTTSCLVLLCHYVSGQGIYNSARIVVSGSAFITVQDGGFTNAGAFFPGTGTVAITGTAATGASLVGGRNPTSFNHLIINKTSNHAQLAGNIIVNGNLSMQAGNLELNLFSIDLGSGAGTILNENNNAKITGTGGGNIVKTVNLNAPSAVNPGNIGIAISSTANLGSTIIKRGHQQQSLTGGGLSINRYFDIEPTNNASLNATLKMYYFDDELAGIDKSELNFYSSEGSGDWTLKGRDNNDPVNDWVLKNNLDQLSRWTLSGSTNTALPVKLLSFTAKLSDRKTNLQWITAQEINSLYFDVQRSQDGTLFNQLLVVPAQGNSNLEHRYTALDENPFNGINYYRLKETDKDGHISFSPVVYVKLNDGITWSAFPNPASGIFYLAVNLPAATKSVIGLYDANGKLLQEKNVQLNAGNNQLQWNISRLAQGIYFLRSNNSMPVIRIIKK